MSIVGSGEGAHERLGRALDDTCALLDKASANLGAAPSAARIAPADPNGQVIDDYAQTMRADADALRRDLGWFAMSTRTAGFAYAKTEQLLLESFSQGVQTAMHLLGIMARPLVMTGLGGGLFASLLLPAIDRLTQGSTVRRGLELLLEPVAQRLEAIMHTLATAYGPYVEALMADPLVLKTLGYGMRGIDDFLLGLFGMPRMGALSDNDAARILAAAVLPLIANGHRLGSSPVTPRDTSEQEAEVGLPDAAIAGYGAGFEQIVGQGSDIVIRTYALPDGSRHHQVFSLGTQNWTLGEDESGYDLLSNLENAVSQPELYGTAQGIREAMLAAGIEPGESVDFFGYSQGGAAVALVAAEGTFEVASVTTYAAPMGKIEMPDGVDWVQIQIDQDSVAQTAGMSQHRSSALIIETSVDIQASSPFEYHQADAYRQAIAAIEASGDTAALQQAQERAARLEGATIEGQQAFELDR